MVADVPYIKVEARKKGFCAGSENGVAQERTFMLAVLFFVSVTISVYSIRVLYANYCVAYRLLDTPGDPLFLTDLILAGHVDEARTLARVPSLLSDRSKPPVVSYSGFLTVNRTADSNLFFWYFPAEVKDAPVVLWLQGGPGASSLYGLFMEHGPYEVPEKDKVTLRKYRWTRAFSMLYIDNPVGTGFSFTGSNDSYCQNEDQVADALYEAMRQFFLLFPSAASYPFYVTGESYGGKYVPSLTYKIHQQGGINLAGMAIGNGLCDPVHMLNYGQYLYQLGLIDDNALQVFLKVQDETTVLVNQGKYDEAFDKYDKLILNDLSKGSLFQNFTGFTSYYNYVTIGDTDMAPVMDFLLRNGTRRAIHVGNLTFNTNQEVEAKLRKDIFRSVADKVSAILDAKDGVYKVMFYNGQLDIIVAYPLTVQFLRNLQWNGSAEYLTAEREIWRVGGTIAGYKKRTRNMTEVLVRAAGHMVPADQPAFAYDLLKNFVHS